ncbi:hypothetical protein ACET3Z_013930 [Daucus carota]
MMGQGSHMAPAEGNPAVAVVGQQFMVPYPVDLTIVRKMLTISEGNFGVTDANGNIMFQVKGKLLSFHDRRILLDAAGNPVLSLQQKMISLHNRWEVYRGDSKDSRDLLFTVKKSSLLQVKTQLDVFLASNTSEHNCDFKIKGSWFERSCTIYAGTTSTVIAQMHKRHSVSSIVLGKDKFAVTVYPHVDYAFIVALIVILEEINEARSNEGSSGSYMAPAGGNPAVASCSGATVHGTIPAYPVDLTIVRKMMTISEGNFGVTDANGNIMFKVKCKFLNLGDRRILLDAADYHHLFRFTIIPVHEAWCISFRRSSSSPSHCRTFRWSRQSRGLNFTLPSYKTVFEVDIDSFVEKPWRLPGQFTRA